MARSRPFTVWLPVIAWAAVIFTLSSIPSLSTGLGTWDTILRKGAHLTEYAVLGGLLYRARMSRHHHISREELSVREHMSSILRALQERRVLEFGELFEPARGVAVLVVTFLALLELARELLIEITQSECFAPIYVKLGYAR